MDVRQLKHFVALVETGTAHAAADDQHISQPGLSGSIKRLENQLVSRYSTGEVEVWF